MARASQLSVRARAFSLLEVVVAVGIFAIGMVAVVGLFSPVAKSVSVSADAEAAARVADALRTRLQTMPFADVVKLLKHATGSGHELSEADARADYDPARDEQILFASRDGAKIGSYDDPVWIDLETGRASDREKFFEIALIRNEAVSPRAGPPPAEGETAPDPDATAYALAYIARVRWPAFVREGATVVPAGSNPTGLVKFDHSMKQVLFFAGAVTR